MSGDTSIRLKRKTRSRLDAYGMRGETFDQIVNRLLDELEAARAELERLHKEMEK